MRVDFSSLPPVDNILKETACLNAVSLFGHRATVDAIRATLADERVLMRAGRIARDSGSLALMAFERLKVDATPSLRPVYNLTGTILHTNLGRAQMPEAAIAAATSAMRHAVALEYDLENGSRGERDDHLRDLICELTGAEDATLVNNNAAAVLLVLNTFAGKSRTGLPGASIISRGELIEIGGSFRMPDIMESAGCKLVEVGTTNRTHLKDYENALDETTALILKVHTSNYRIDGFSKSVSTLELSELARHKHIPLVEDLGSGTLVNWSDYGLPHEPTVQETVQAGADIVTFSGDKLLGGPQAGFIVGKAEMIAAINRNPMKRSLRVDKVRLAALEALLRLYRNEETRTKTIPTLRFLDRQQTDIAHQAAQLCELVRPIVCPQFQLQLIECESQVGSGAMPSQTLPSYGLAMTRNESSISLSVLAANMRKLPIPVIGRIKDNKFIMDLRCLEDNAAFVNNLGYLSL